MEELIANIKQMTTLITKLEFALASLNQEIIEALKTNCDAINYAYNTEELDTLKCLSINYPVIHFKLYKISLEIQASGIIGITKETSDVSTDEIKLGVLRELSLHMSRGSEI